MYMDSLMRLYREVRQEPGGMSKLEGKEVAKYRYAWLSMVMRIHQYVDEVQWEAKEGSSGPYPSRKLPWLMKDPNHSAYLPELMEEFPDARLVFTHRSPAEIVPSLAKLMVIFNSVHYIPGSPCSTSAEMGAETVKRMQHYANGFVSFTKAQSESSDYQFHKVQVGQTTTSNGAIKRVDFAFRDLVRDIPSAIETIYAQFFPGEPGPSDEAKRAFLDYLEANRREKAGSQRRSLEDFSLSSLDEEFKEYNELFLSQFQ